MNDTSNPFLREDFEPPPKPFWQRKWFFFACLLLFGLVSIGSFVATQFQPNAGVTISRETTYLTEPVDEEGYVDYLAAIRERAKEGVTPEENAAVLLWQAWGPAEIDADLRDRFYSELRIAPLSEEGDYLRSTSAKPLMETAVIWFKSKDPDLQGLPPEPADVQDVGDVEEAFDPNVDFKYQDKFDSATQSARKTPWTREEYPWLAEWIENNSKPLDLILAASRKTQYYSPLIEDTVNEGLESAPLISSLLLDARQIRDVARILTSRAMLHSGKGNPTAAREDLMALMRLARLYGAGYNLVEELVAIASNNMALDALQSHLHHTNWESNDLREWLAEIRQLPPCSNMSQTLDQGERLVYLDAMTHIARYGVGEGGGIGGEFLAQWHIQSTVDWNIPLRVGNEWYDKIVATTRLETVVEREAASRAFDEEFEQTMEEAADGVSRVKALVSRRARSDMIANLMVALMLPAVNAALQGEHRSLTNQALTEAAFVLAIHRAEQGHYPESWEELSPELRTLLPDDPYSEKPFHFEKRGEGYVLWSVGPNLRDDKASNNDRDIVNGEYADRQERGWQDMSRPRQQDDIIVRIPHLKSSTE